MKIKQLRELKYSERKIATKLGISRTTVTKYLKKNPEEVALWLASTKSRTKKLDRYQKEILDWLRKHPDTSAAIVHDRLEEKYPDLSVAESTVRAYINDLRKQNIILAQGLKYKFDMLNIATIFFIINLIVYVLILIT